MGEPSSINFCRNFWALGGRNNDSLKLFNYSAPTPPVLTQTLGTSNTYYTELVPVHYTNYGMYAFYINATSTAINVATVSAALRVVDSYTITTSQRVINLLLDDYYPLMFYSGTKIFGVLNVSDPTNSYIIAQYNTTQTFNPGTPQGIAIPQGQNYAYFTQTSSNFAPLLRWDLSDFRTMTVDVPYRYSQGQGKSIATDYKRRFLTFIDSTGRQFVSVSSPHYKVASIM